MAGGLVSLTLGEACEPGGARWTAGEAPWGGWLARLVLAGWTPDKGPRLSPWVSGWVWEGRGTMYGRTSEGVRSLGALVLDVDASEGASPLDASERWKRALRAALGAEVRAVVWPSRSWGIKAGARCKALVPLARPVPVLDALPWCAAVGEALARLGVEVDPACLTLAQNQDLPTLPALPYAPSVEVWPSEPQGEPLVWALAEALPGRFLDPYAPERLPSVGEAVEQARARASEAPPSTTPARPPARHNAEPHDAARAERRARARLGAWGVEVVNATVDKIRAGAWGGRNSSAYRGGLWLHRLARTHVGSLGPALDASEVEAVVDAEVLALGLPNAEARDVLRSIRRTTTRRGGLDKLPDDLASILSDFHAEGGR